MRFRFSLGGMLALFAVLATYLAAASYAVNATGQFILSVLSPVIFLLAAIAWMDPGGLSQLALLLWRRVRGNHARPVSTAKDARPNDAVCAASAVDEPVPSSATELDS